MSRAVAPVVGVTVLLFLTVLLAASVGAALVRTVPEPAPTASFAAEADAESDRITLTHRGGETLQASALRVTVRVDGRELAHQPPVPFFAARGFESGPTGPFNSADDGSWQAGERASFTLASTNDPRLHRGAEVTVVIATDRAVIGVVETTAA